MRRQVTCAVLILAVSVSYGLYRLKYQVRDLERQATELARQVERDGAAIEVLSTELSYLTRPERLQALNDRFLKLTPAEAVQIGSLGDVPARRARRLAGMTPASDGGSEGR
ncbi:MAG: hypothetical protein ACE5EM_10020 [Sphingomonadales bacterium]